MQYWPNKGQSEVPGRFVVNVFNVTMAPEDTKESDNDDVESVNDDMESHNDDLFAKFKMHSRVQLHSWT